MKTVLLVMLTVLAFQSTAQDAGPDSGKHYNPFEEWMWEGVYVINTYNKSGIPNYAGTAFIINYKGERYVVTAKHLFEGDSNMLVTPYKKSLGKFTFRLYNGIDSLQTFTEPFFTPENKSIDAVVCRIRGKESLSSVNTSHQLGFKSIKIGNYAVFAGFPSYTLHGKIQGPHSKIGGKRYPLVKIGRISGLREHDPVGNNVYIDAINMSGFSGSPMYSYNDSLDIFILSGVITGSVPQNTYVDTGTELEINKGVFSNSGVSTATFIESIYDLIDRLIAENRFP